MNELATEKMESSKEPIRQEASVCPLQAMHTQRLALRRHKRRASRNRSLALLLGSVAAAAMQLPEHAWAETKMIETPAHARLQGLESLRRAVRQDGGVPLPEHLNEFVKDRKAAVRLGKALFWDMQVGSDGVQACASCHFHAGTDDRSKNALNPNQQTLIDNRADDVIGYFFAPFTNNPRFEIKQPNATLTREDFPFVKSIQALNLTPDGSVEPGPNNSNDIAGSMGVFFNRFDGIRPGFPVDLGTPQPDPDFHVDGGANVRRVEPRNTPTVINAVFNFTNFWDGHANPKFNAQTAFGDQDPTATILVNRPGTGLVEERISLNNASLASQAMAPPRSSVEMSFGDSVQVSRSFPEIAQKLLRPSPQTGLRLRPLGLQKVHRRDSVLGTLSSAPFRGLSTSYKTMIENAFAEQYWNSTERRELPSTPSATEFTQMEANFGLFFGLAIEMYESTLVADQTPFDQWMETGRFNRGFGKPALAGLNLFVNQGQCIRCHAGPELTKASVRNAEGGNNAIRAMAMAQGTALYDNGFYNISVTPTTDDIGRGDLDPFNNGSQPLAFARQALFERLGVFDLLGIQIGFPIIGNNHIPAVDEDLGSPVCADTNANGVCEPSETILPEFERVAVDGAFKAPGLRNVELTGPYFHNGGMATLRQVVQFYNRGGNFCSFNLRDLDPHIRPLGLTASQEKQLVAFLVSLTDPRVKYRKAPFDQPEIRIPDDGLDTFGTRRIRAVGARGSHRPLGTFLHLDPEDAIFTPTGICSKDPS